MTRGQYHNGPDMLSVEAAAEEGYFIQYPDGYKSWCPKASFEASGRPIDGMTFGQAIEALKQDKKVARKGWNGKGMYLFLADAVRLQTNAVEEKEHEVMPCIVMKTAQDNLQPGWLASQNDMLSDDWTLVD
ncbi:MAG: DUF2829 domain-containing protein [Kiritimatiellae bacterium]|nr:DUF2829 domain-containing protein [Kiritimatiellia bacterium]